MLSSLLKLDFLAGARTKLGSAALILTGIGSYGVALAALAGDPIDLVTAKTAALAGTASIGLGLSQLGIRFAQ